MRLAQGTIALLLLVLLPFRLSAPACAEPPTAAQMLARDSRLARTARIETEGISIGELLARLSEAASVPLRADREVADEKVIVFGPPRPFSEILNDLAALVGAEWQERTEKSGDTPYFVLKKMASARKRETMLADSVTDQMFQQMEAQVRALNEAPQELARRPENERIQYFLSQPDGKARRATEFYASLAPQQRRELFERWHIRQFFASLSPEWQAVSGQILASWLEEYERNKRESIISKFAAVGKPRETPPELEIEFLLRGDGVATLHFYPGFVTFALLRAKLPQIPRHGDPFTGAEIPADAILPVPPALETALKESPTDWPTHLRHLSETANLPIVADYYRLRCASDVPTPLPALSPSDPVAALDAFCAREGCLWWTRGGTLLIRKSDWYDRRLYEPPDAWLVGVTKDIATRDGWAAYADVLRLKELTPRQIIGVATLNDIRRGWLPYALSTPIEKLAGISELLNLLRVRALPTGRLATPLLSREDTSSAAFNQALEQSTLRYVNMTPYQQQLILPFLAAQSKSLDGKPVEGFFCRLSAYAPQDADRSYRYQRIVLHWQVGQGGTQEDYEISLPLTLPDDRRDKTKIAILPI